MNTPQLHVVFGAGQVGTTLARLLASRRHGVRLASRSASVQKVNGIETLRVDALDAGQVAEAVRGATTVYHCMNAPTSPRPGSASCRGYRRAS